MTTPLSPSGPLAGKTAIITGASRGIGRAIAGSLAAAGARVFLTAQRAAGLDAAVAEIRAEQGPSQAASLATDLRRPEAAAQVVDAALAAFGAIDIVVNNAGAAKRGRFLFARRCSSGGDAAGPTTQPAFGNSRTAYISPDIYNTNHLLDLYFTEVSAMKF